MIPHTNFNNKGHLLYLHGSWLHFCICLYLAFHIEILMFSVAMGCPKKKCDFVQFHYVQFWTNKKICAIFGRTIGLSISC